MVINNGINLVGETNGTAGQVYNGTGITPVIINGAIQLSPELWWGYYLLGWVIFFLFKKVILRFLLKAK